MNLTSHNAMKTRNPGEVWDEWFEGLVQAFSNLEQVDAAALGGSRAKGSFDPSSDYDLYIYLNEELPVDVRRNLLESFCSYMEINNQFWETEDDCTLKNGIDIDIIYRSLSDIKDQVLQVKNGLAYNGYTTCLWDNLITSQVLFDKSGNLSALCKDLDIPYPQTLQRNIVTKNLRLLSGNLPSYDKQIKKAISRSDLPSISHRTAAFLESYFDILFAMNGMLHPGEKRMMEKLKNAEILPEDFEENLNTLFKSQYTDSKLFLETLDGIVRNMHKLAVKEGYIPDRKTK